MDLTVSTNQQPIMDIKSFLFSLPEKAKPEVLEGHNTLFHFDIADAGQFTVQIKDGKMEVAEGFNGEPSCKVNTSAESFSKLLKGELNPMMAMMTGKLKISNPGEMLKYAKIFGLM
jgi:putative sterol carrier protein